MSQRHYILATAGHVDHGKSALVKALTGTDPDRLPEEQARGITIDLGFAHLELPGPEPDAGTLRLGIVDVPGHEDFVKNMVAGVGSVDLALLVVAADDGWMPQTEEHLQILAYLGVRRGVVALTKSDLTPGGTAPLIDAIRAELAGSPLADAPIVATSAHRGEGLDELRAALRSVAAAAPPPVDLGKPRLAVDRVFSLPGIGTVATGTLTGGSLEKGQTVVLRPGERTSRIRSLQSDHQEVARAQPGMRTALNLPEIEPLSELDPDGLARGQVVTLGTLGEPHDTLDVWLEKSARLQGRDTPAARPLKDGAVVRIHHGSTNGPGRVRLRDATELKPGQRVLAEIRLGQPVFLFAGDRLVVRDAAEQATLAGGLVLDPDADRRLWRSEEQGSFLQARARRPEDPGTFLATELARNGATRRERVLLKTRFSFDEVEATVARMVEAGELIARAGLLFAPQWWEALRRSATEAIQFEHHAHPERPGLSLAQMRVVLKPALGCPGTFEALLTDLLASGFERSGTFIGRTGHRLALPPHLEAAGKRIRAALMARPFDPPSRKELAPDRTSFEALRFLLNSGEAVAVGPDLVVSIGAYNRAVRKVRKHLEQNSRASVSDLRQAVGCTRRLMVPLCEKLDQEGVTRREGDWRVPGARTASDTPPAAPPDAPDQGTPVP
ncbi:MAG: selenocysteine-specific translation elongation factor [Verrucomicrobiales bacterium]|nr:selenocysteine-specific translation elongation factor [Verrucomicrobiales bacterium]